MKDHKLTRPQSKDNQTSVWQLLQSLLAAAIGVQSSKNYQRDFASKSIWPFIIGGLVFTILFIIALVVSVSLFF